MTNINNVLFKSIALFTLLNILLLSNSAFANNVVHDVALLKCAEQSDQMERLACFDNLVIKVKHKVSRKLADNSVIATKDITKINKINTINSSLPTQSSTDFGQEDKLKQQELSLKQVEFIVKSATLSIRKNWHLIFDNDQVWYATEANSLIKFKAGDIVVIKRGVFNSFSIKKKNSKRSVRAKRIK